MAVPQNVVVPLRTSFGAGACTVRATVGGAAVIAISFVTEFRVGLALSLTETVTWYVLGASNIWGGGFCSVDVVPSSNAQNHV